MNPRNAQNVQADMHFDEGDRLAFAPSRPGLLLLSREDA
jgi:hypothetical protein